MSATVEMDGRYVRARAIAFVEVPIVERDTNGGYIAYNERWDAQSVVEPDTLPLRLLADHDDRQPVGWIDSFDTQTDGLYMTARLIGGSQQLEHLRALALGGLRSGVSIGFRANKSADKWARPATPGGLASVLRRNARISEVSIVPRPAIVGSEILSITNSAPGFSPRSRAVLDAVPERTPAAHAAMVGRSAAQARWEGAHRRPARPTADDVLTEARALIDAGSRWRNVPAAPTSTRQRTPAQDWQTRWDKLVRCEPDAHGDEQYAHEAWLSRLLALLNEPHD